MQTTLTFYCERSVDLKVFLLRHIVIHHDLGVHMWNVRWVDFKPATAHVSWEFDILAT